MLAHTQVHRGSDASSNMPPAGAGPRDRLGGSCLHWPWLLSGVFCASCSTTRPPGPSGLDVRPTDGLRAPAAPGSLSLQVTGVDSTRGPGQGLRGHRRVGFCSVPWVLSPHCQRPFHLQPERHLFTQRSCYASLRN